MALPRSCVEWFKISPEEFHTGIGWWQVGQRITSPASEGSAARQSRPKTRDHVNRKVIATTTRAARMPDVLPREDTKVIVRPRGGLNIARTQTGIVASAIMAAARVSREDGAANTFCPNLHQNIMVVSTPDKGRALSYAKIQAIRIGDKIHEVGAYQTTPYGTVKGIIRGIPIEDTPAEIDRNVVSSRNPLARGAQRIGNTTTVIVVFEGQKVPNYVWYGPVLTRCSLYRKHFDVCKQCGKIGHRRDVCPNPNMKVCFDCGANNPVDGHECTPKCKLCGGQHPTADRECKNKYKTPYVVTKRQWERKMAEQRVQQQLASGEFPPLMTSAGASGTAGRHESRSRGNNSESRNRSMSRHRRSQSKDRVAWADVVKSGVAKKEQQQQQQQSPPFRGGGGKFKDESEAMKALREANQALRKKNTELEATVNKLSKEMAEIKKMMTVQLHEQQAQPLSPQPQQMAMTEDEPEVAVNPRTENAASAGPAPKRRAIENLKERRLSDRVDNLEDRLTHFEEYIRTTFTKTITDRFIAIEQTCQQFTTTVQNLATQMANFQQTWIGHQPPQPQQQ
ncbi:uncharacterized protein [Dermacentor andersoni]|uniref:uncharacterized protein n=1 Tax=Dermacentor andersoni TaxID=34620 RepID=UPI002155B996|nr:uncharacterized protein LOC126535430 [Dermacentor andersoni]